MFTRKMIVAMIMVVLVFMVSYTDAKVRNVKAIGEAALRQGIISSAPPKGRDFTKIDPNVVYKEGELLVRFAPEKINGKLCSTSSAEKTRILDSLGGAVENRSFDIVPGLSVVKLPKGQTVKDALKTFNKTDGILYAEPDYEVKMCSTFPNDPNGPNSVDGGDLWGMYNIGQTGGTPGADISAPEAWDIATGSSNIIVAVIDTGVDYNHPDLAANMWVNEDEADGNTGVDDDGNGYIDDIYGYDFRNNDGDPMDDSSPVYHGTHVSGTIGAVGNNNEGVVGVNWNVRIMALKFLGSDGGGPTSDAISCIGYSVLMDANLSNNSWGGGGYSQALKDAIDTAGAANMLFVAAAGNYPQTAPQDNDAPGGPYFYPASYNSDNIIAVMSTDKNDDMSSFSHYGNISVDLGAPGSDILSCKGGGGYQYLSGTSMAAPHVAGACALLLSKYPDSTYQEVKDTLVLRDTVDPTLPGLCVSGGRLNLYNALLRHNQKIHNINQDTWHDTIQDAINNATNGDVIVVYPGTYHELINFKGKAITLRSTNPDDWNVVEATIIDANNSGYAVTFNQGEDANSVLEGVTVRRSVGYGTYGILCSNSGPTIKRCSITNNSSAGIYCVGDGAVPTITNNIIKGSYYGILFQYNAAPVIKNNLIYNNKYGLYGSVVFAAIVKNNTIVNNTTCGVYSDYGIALPISNCIIWNNNDDLSSGSTATYSCIEDGDAGTGNISSDPCFADANYFHLKWNSPCINAGDPCFIPETNEVDIDGDPRVTHGRVDIGADEYYKPILHVPGDFATIQAAINAAYNGDTIEVYPGTYYEDVNFNGKAIIVRSTDPNDWDVVADTIIDGNGATTAVFFNSGEDSNSILTGITVKGAGNGIVCASTSPTISKCIVKNNARGIWGSSAAAPTITNNKICNNGSYNIILQSITAAPIVRNNEIYDANYGIWIVFPRAAATISNNTIVRNAKSGISKLGGTVSPIITNSIIWDSNDDLYGSNASYSCIQDGDAGQGNISSDPLFVDPNNDDYRLSSNSPCIDIGDPNGNYVGQTDIDGDDRVIDISGKGDGIVDVDMGADEVPLTGVKPGESIQDAINNATNGDVIVVYPGTYYEQINFNGKAITLRSINPDDWNVVASTIIDGGASGYAVTFNHGEDANSVLEGVTVRYGGIGTCGHGILCSGSDPSIKRCNITSYGYGGSCNGIYCSNGSPTIERCSIANNPYAGIWCIGNGTVPTITNNIIKGSSYGILFQYNAAPVIKNNLIYNNKYGLYGSVVFAAIVKNNTIVNNTTCGVYSEFGIALPISNCIIWNNNDDLSSGSSATYSNIEDGDAGTGNISADPCFVDADNNDFHIGIHSPCVNAGDPNGDYAGQTDIDGDPRVIGSYVDMGADEVILPVAEAHQWGLDEKSGTTAYDSVDDDDGTFNGNDPCWVRGNIGGAVDLNGVSDYFSVPTLDSAYYSDQNFTVAGWFRTSQLTGIQTIVGQWSCFKPYPYSSDYYYGWQILVESKKVVARFGNANPPSDITGTSDVNDGQWHHFALVYPTKDVNAVLYVDGQSQGTPGKKPFYLYDTKFRIGDGSYISVYSNGTPVLKGGPFKGMIDDVMIYNRALTAEEVTALYESGQ